MTRRRKARLMLDLGKSGFLPGQTVYSTTESRLSTFDQMDADTKVLESDVMEVAVGSIEPCEVKSSTPEPPSIRSVPVNKPRAKRGPRSGHKPLVVRTDEKSPPLPPPTNFTAPGTEALKFIANQQPGVTGIGVVRLNNPSNV
ncbi:hypothetical protein DBT53_004450, partial [Aerococcus mictus]|uniref:hypothetical protein n=1 Tax=Aerococcus mictus TaxID=2976810 RepID=UPI002FD2BB82